MNPADAAPLHQKVLVAAGAFQRACADYTCANEEFVKASDASKAAAQKMDAALAARDKAEAELLTLLGKPAKKGKSE